ncbi:MAG: hypothetical protein KC613_05830, partial [Myxococcales bacterium]|nr:hypothetical protein [Myxococcales bacterium]
GGAGGVGGGMPCDCGPGCAEAECVEASPCAADDGCRAGRICEGEACVDGCADDAACAATPGTPFCVDGRCGNCATDEDCFGAAVCNALKVCEAPEQCEATRECLGDVCDAQTSDCQPAFDCARDGCPGEMICGASGQCRPNLEGPCRNDDECAFGDVCVDVGRENRCTACVADTDCPGRQVCQPGPGGSQCVEPASCELDEDCIGGRRCEGGQCAAPQCVGDVFDGNDGPATAQRMQGDLVYRALNSCGDDWYVMAVPANTVATITLRQRDRGVDLDLILASADGRVLERASTGMPVEALVVSPSANERDVVFAVVQNGPASVGGYDLEIGFGGAGDACLDDAFEAGGGDDDISTSRFVRSPSDAGFGGAVTGRICAGDDDWLCFAMQARETFTATGEAVGGATLTAELVSAADPGEIIATGAWGGEQAMDLNEALAVGTYCLRLSAATGSAAYSLNLNAFTSAVSRVCSDATPLIGLGDVDGSADGELPREAENSMSPLCGAGLANGGENAFTIEVDGPRLLTARVTGLGSGSLGDPVLSLRGDCKVAASELGCSTSWVDPDDPFLPRTNPTQLRVPLPEAGVYTLLVDGIDVGRDPTYRLEAEITGLAAPPANDTCDGAQAVELRAGSTELAVNLDQASDDFLGCFGSGGPDAVYAVSLPADSRVTVRAFSQPAGFAVGAYLTSRCGGVGPIACGLGFDEVIPAGDYFLVVDGVDSNARGRAVLDVTVDPVGPVPANDTCDAAQAVQGASGSVQGDTRAAADDYQLPDNNRCTGHDSRGGDVAFTVPVTGGQRTFIQAVPEAGWDLSLYVVADCDRPLDDCRGSDGALAEAVVYTPAADGTALVVVDGSAGESGRFTLNWGPAECEADGECDAGRCEAFRCVAP